MKTKHCIALLAIGSLLIPALWAIEPAAEKSGGSDRKLAYVDERSSLRGLQGVMVLVAPLGPAVERFGLTREAILTDAELQLRQYGVKVLSADEYRRTPGHPGLLIVLNVLGADDKQDYPLAVNMSVTLNQDVALIRDPAMCCEAPTWAQVNVALSGRASLGQVRESVRDMVASFINDYLAVNPKQSGPWQSESGDGISNSVPK